MMFSEASPTSSVEQAQQRQTAGSWQPLFSCADEHTARTHYTKTYGVLSEMLAEHRSAFEGLQSFLDLGCAPGGFSSRLLDEFPEARGFGVSLPVNTGGFPMLLIHDRLHVQYSDLMAVSSAVDLECSAEAVDLVLGDAQNLARRGAKPEGSGGRKGGRRGAAVGGATVSGQPDAGVQAVCAALGIWALTVQELMLGFGKLRERGTLVFRFGLPSRGAREEAWYREAMDRLFGLLFTHFVDVLPFKSQTSHQADATFYVVATGFRREAFAEAELDTKLREAIASIMVCEKPKDLPECMQAFADFVTDDSRSRTEHMVDSAAKLRDIGVASRQRVETAGRSNAEAALFISPVPFNLTMPRLRERLEKYGKISYIRRRAHPIGVGADAIVQFVQASHAKAALAAIVSDNLLGGNISAQRLCDVRGAGAD